MDLNDVREIQEQVNYNLNNLPKKKRPFRDAIVRAFNTFKFAHDKNKEVKQYKKENESVKKVLDNYDEAKKDFKDNLSPNKDLRKQIKELEEKLRRIENDDFEGLEGKNLNKIKELSEKIEGLKAEQDITEEKYFEMEDRLNEIKSRRSEPGVNKSDLRREHKNVKIEQDEAYDRAEEIEENISELTLQIGEIKLSEITKIEKEINALKKQKYNNIKRARKHAKKLFGMKDRLKEIKNNFRR